MRFKTSLFNKGLMISDFKRLWWISALYALFLFFILPFDLLMKDQRIIAMWKTNSPGFSDIFFANNLQFILIGTIPVIIAVLLFKYLQTPRSCAMAHSLPCSRKTLYLSHCASGLILLTAPVFLNGFLLVIVKAASSAGPFIAPLDMLQWLVITSAFELLFFAFAVFVGMFTGNSISHIAFTYILNVLPVSISYLLDYNLKNLIYGYGESANYRSVMDNLPIFLLSKNTFNLPFLTVRYIIYAILSVVFFICALAVYEKRHLESAGDIITFTSIRPVFKYGVTICATLISGLYFFSMPNKSFGIIVFGYFITSLLGYYISEVLLRKSLKVWNTYKGYLCYAALLILVLAGIKTDIVGYEKRVPDVQEVKSVYLGYSVDDWQSINYRKHENTFESINSSSLFKDRENIQNIVSVHKQLIQKKDFFLDTFHHYPTQYIIYSLKNGSNIIRCYTIDWAAEASALRPIYESKEYKEARFPVLVQKAEDLKFIEIGDYYRTNKKPVMLSSNAEISEFTLLLKKDIENLRYETLVSDSDAPLYLQIQIANLKDQSVTYALRSNYLNVIGWLKANGYYEKVTILPKDVNSIVLTNNNRSSKDLLKEAEIKDVKIIEELLNISESSRFILNSRGNCINVLFKTSRSSWNYTLDLDTPMSDGLKSYIKQVLK